MTDREQLDKNSVKKPWQTEEEALLPEAVQNAIEGQMMRFGEMPDRTSPEDFPDGYVLTRQEIVSGIIAVLESAKAPSVGACMERLASIDRYENELREQSRTTVHDEMIRILCEWARWTATTPAATERADSTADALVSKYPNWDGAGPALLERARELERNLPSDGPGLLATKLDMERAASRSREGSSDA